MTRTVLITSTFERQQKQGPKLPANRAKLCLALLKAVAPQADRRSRSAYATCLAHAQESEISPANVADWLASEGGVEGAIAKYRELHPKLTKNGARKARPAGTQRITKMPDLPSGPITVELNVGPCGIEFVRVISSTPTCGENLAEEVPAAA